MVDFAPPPPHGIISQVMVQIGSPSINRGSLVAFFVRTFRV
jgi:hypothetical protein